MNDRPGAPAVVRSGSPPLLEAWGLVKTYPAPGGPLWEGLTGASSRRLVALDGVDLAVRPGERLAVVGESGSGKTTLGRLLVRLLDPDRGELRWDGVDCLSLSGRSLRRRRRHFQMVFQDPLDSLPPHRTVGAILAEPLAVHGLVPRRQRAERVVELLGRVGLEPDLVRRHPHALSGGQRQRLGLARALAVEPRVLVADEPVSALDVSVRAQVVNLLLEKVEELGLALVFIAHDLALVRHVARRVMVLDAGRVVEEGPVEAVFGDPSHPTTRALLDAVPRPVPPARP